MSKYFVDHSGNIDIAKYFNDRLISEIAIDDYYNIDQIEDGLFFIHAQDGDEKGWKDAANKKLKSGFVFMRTGTRSFPDDLPQNCHWCEYPAHKLKLYPRVDLFLQNWDKGLKHFYLLKSQQTPILCALAILCQGYLIAYAGSDGKPASDLRLSEESYIIVQSALNSMGWKDLCDTKDFNISPPQRDLCKGKEYWQTAVRQDHDIENIHKVEWMDPHSVGNEKKWGAVKELLQEITKNNNEIDPAKVANAYLALKSKIDEGI